MEINLLLPEIALSVMILALFCTTLASPSGYPCYSGPYPVGKSHSPLRLYSFKETGLLFSALKGRWLSQVFKDHQSPRSFSRYRTTLECAALKRG